MLDVHLTYSKYFYRIVYRTLKEGETRQDLEKLTVSFCNDLLLKVLMLLVISCYSILVLV